MASQSDKTCQPCMGSGGSGLNAICHHCFGDGKAKTFEERFNHIRNHSNMPAKALPPELRGPMRMFISMTILVKDLLAERKNREPHECSECMHVCDDPSCCNLEGS